MLHIVYCWCCRGVFVLVIRIYFGVVATWTGGQKFIAQVQSFWINRFCHAKPYFFTSKYGCFKKKKKTRRKYTCYIWIIYVYMYMWWIYVQHEVFHSCLRIAISVAPKFWLYIYTHADIRNSILLTKFQAWTDNVVTTHTRLPGLGSRCRRSSSTQEQRYPPPLPLGATAPPTCGRRKSDPGLGVTTQDQEYPLRKLREIRDINLIAGYLYAIYYMKT